MHKATHDCGIGGKGISLMRTLSLHSRGKTHKQVRLCSDKGDMRFPDRSTTSPGTGKAIDRSYRSKGAPSSGMHVARKVSALRRWLLHFESLASV